MRPPRCLPALALVLSCTSNSTLTDGSCTGFACVHGPDAGPTGGASGPRNEQIFEVNPVRDIDVVFMVDNSPSMSEEQANLRRTFPLFIDELKKLPGGLPDLHIGVVSSDLGAGSTPLANGGCPRPGGDRGIFQTKPACGLDPSARFISSSAGGTMNNFQGSIEQVFSCMADLGTVGCGYEHQLQSTRVALYESITKENVGFLRENALLVIVLVSDEDDCSAAIDTDLFVDDASFPMTTASFRCSQVGHLCDGKAPPVGEFDAPLENCAPNPAGRLLKVSDIVQSIRGLKRRPDQQIVVSGIFGWPNNPTGARYRYVRTMEGIDVAPICQSANGQAAAGLRLKQFVESFGTAGSLFGICNDDFSPALQKLGATVADKIGSVCVSAPVVDAVPTDPGVQADCQVLDRIPSGNAFADEAVPPCSGGSRSAHGACWQLVADTLCDASGFKIVVDRGGNPAIPGTEQVVRCLTCADANDPRCKR